MAKSNVYDIRRARKRQNLNNKKRNGSRNSKNKSSFDMILKSVTSKGLLIPLCIIGAFVLLILLWSFTHKNAQEILVGDIKVATVYGKKIKVEDLQRTAVEKLKLSEGVNVAVNEVATSKLVHANKRNCSTSDNAVTKIIETLTYKLEATKIYVNGVELAIVKSPSDVEQIKNDIISEYIKSDENIIYTHKDFLEPFETKLDYVERTEIMNNQQAYNILTTQTEATDTYTVVAGDYLGLIASKKGTSIDKLKELNEGLTENLKIGQQLNLILLKPLLSVETVEEYKMTVVEPKTVETRENHSQSKGYKKSVQQGKDGQADVTMSLTRINGLPIEAAKEIGRAITLAPVTEIIEIGTK